MPSALPLVTDGLAIGRARLSGPGGSRALLQTALDHVALDRLGLGVDEILYVPRLRGPVGLRAETTRHFANGLALSLRDIAGGAERDPVGGGASDRACRFSTRAAFAAWLIVRVLETGTAEAATVVRVATGRAAPRDWWRRDVLSEGRILVPVLARLIDAGKAAPWLARLDASEIALATTTLMRDYALDIACVEDPPTPAPRPTPRAVRTARRVDGGIRPAEPTIATQVAAASAAIAARDGTATALPSAARRVLVAAAVLARDPSIPRAALAFAIARQVPPTPSTRHTPGRVADAGLPPRARVATPGAAIALEPRERASQRLPAPLTEPTVRAPATRPATVADSGPGVRLRRAVAPQTVQRPPSDRAVEPGNAPRTPIASPVGDHLVQPPEGAYPPPLIAPETAFDTEFGGLVFLVNAFLAMGLYPDFTRPLDPALPLTPLALVDRLGLHWFGAAYRRDPLHRWVRLRGLRGTLPRRWRAEPAWLGAFPAGRAWHDGMTLWHSAGFPLANHCSAAAAARFAAALALPALPDADRDRALRPAPGWLECLALFLAERLRRAAPDGAVTAASLVIRARAVLGEARFDLRFALADLPIALRLAGLDRDPGWLPSEGRDLRFHFG